MDEVEILKAIKELEDKVNKPKDTWDKLQALSGMVAAVLIPIVLLVITQRFDERQRTREDIRSKESARVLELDTIEKFTKHLADPDTKLNEVAILAVCALGNQELATQLARLYRSRGTETALDNIYASGTSCAPKKEAAPPRPVTAEPSDVNTANAKSGWAFLGTYSDTNNTWSTNYFDFAKTTNPRSLVGEDLPPKTSVNLREGLPNPDGTFPRVVDVLKPGSRVRILELQRWQTTGFVWARVSYVPAKD